jgi:CBS domain-containing protein
MITARELQSALLAREALGAMLAGDLMRTDVPVAHESDTLDTALEKLSVREVDAIPVVDPGTRRLLGVLTRERMMQAYGEALSADG